MAHTLQVTIVSAEKAIFSGEAERVIAPGEAGELGILPQHAPLLTPVNTVRVDLRCDSGAFHAEPRVRWNRDLRQNYINALSNAPMHDVPYNAVENGPVSSGRKLTVELLLN